MKELEVLLDKRWVLKNDNKDLYYKIRNQLPEMRNFFSDKLGCQVIENSLLVKLEKIPAIPETFMGIEEFSSTLEYVFLCTILMFLEDKEAEEQFVLSQLTEYIASNIPNEKIDWTVYSTRLKLIKVLRYTTQQGLLIVSDGSDDVFREEINGEVLYENTGISRYFMRFFQKDVFDYKKPRDLYESDWSAMDEDRGIIRRHRVYKRLLFAPGMYKANGSSEDFEYLKYYGRRVIDELEELFEASVHIHKGSAYFLLEDSNMGNQFPKTSSLSNIILLCCASIREQIKIHRWQLQVDDSIETDLIQLHRLILDVKDQYQIGFGKEYREMNESKFIEVVIDELKRWTFIDIKDRKVVIYPICGKVIGEFPDDIRGK